MSSREPTPLEHDAYDFAIREYQALAYTGTPSPAELGYLQSLVVRRLLALYPDVPQGQIDSAASYGVNQAIADIVNPDTPSGFLDTIGGTIAAGLAGAEEVGRAIGRGFEEAGRAVETGVEYAARETEAGVEAAARELLRGAEAAERAVVAALEAGAERTLAELESLAGPVAGALEAILRAVDLPAAALPVRAPLASLRAWDALTGVLGRDLPGHLATVARTRQAIVRLAR